jgi:hypothetical protein
MPSAAHKKKSQNKKKPQPQPPKPVQPKPQQPQAPVQPKPVEPAKPAAPRDLVDPAVVKDADTKALDPYAYKKNDRAAKLYGPNGIQALDVRQGAIGDCFLAAALAAVAGSRPDAIKNAIKDNADGTYTVRFYELDWAGNKTVHAETVDADLPHNGETPAYARSTEVVEGKQWMELWPSILEKAYANWKGSYDAIGHGGVSGDVMQALTGEKGKYQKTAGVGENDALWTKMKGASDAKKPMTAGSGGEEDPRYKDASAGVYGWHAYTVMGVEETKVGDKTEKFVIMRNPWGKRRRDADAAKVGDTTNSTAGGVFKLSWSEFRRLYDDVTVSG